MPRSEIFKTTNCDSVTGEEVGVDETHDSNRFFLRNAVALNKRNIVYYLLCDQIDKLYMSSIA